MLKIEQNCSKPERNGFLGYFQHQNALWEREGGEQQIYVLTEAKPRLWAKNMLSSGRNHVAFAKNV